ANEAECRDCAFRPYADKEEKTGGRLTYTKTWTKHGPCGEAVFAFTPARPDLQAISGRQGSGPIYVYSRLPPELKSQENKPFAHHAVFLLDTSLSEHPDRFAVNMRLLQKILESDPAIEHFNILTFNVGTAWVEPKQWLPNTEAGRKKAFQRLD